MRRALQIFLNILFTHAIVKWLWYKLRKCQALREPVKIKPYTDMRVLQWGDERNLRSFDEGRLILPKIIWSFWDGMPSTTVQACIRSWERYYTEYDIRILTIRNVYSYLPDLPRLADRVRVQNFSGLVRLYLLEKYGGIWIDSSVIAGSDLLWLNAIFEKEGPSVVAFYNENPLTFRKDHTRPIIENSFLASISGAQFISEWRKRYELCMMSADPTIYYSERSDFYKLTKNFVNRGLKLRNYLLCFIAEQETMLEFRGCHLTLVNGDDDFMKLHYSTRASGNARQLAEYLLLWRGSARYKGHLVKLTGPARRRCDEMIRYGCYSPRSLLGQYVRRQ